MVFLLRLPVWLITRQGFYMLFNMTCSLFEMMCASYIHLYMFIQILFIQIHMVWFQYFKAKW